MLHVHVIASRDVLRNFHSVVNYLLEIFFIVYAGMLGGVLNLNGV
jgi:hypothetical protein